MLEIYQRYGGSRSSVLYDYNQVFVIIFECMKVYLRSYVLHTLHNTCHVPLDLF